MHTESILHPKWVFYDAIKFLEIANHHQHRWCVQMNAWLLHNLATFCTRRWKALIFVDSFQTVHFHRSIDLIRMSSIWYKPATANQQHIFSSIIQFDGNHLKREKKVSLSMDPTIFFASVSHAACFCIVNFDLKQWLILIRNTPVIDRYMRLETILQNFFVGDRSICSSSLFCKHFNSIKKIVTKEFIEFSTSREMKRISNAKERKTEMEKEREHHVCLIYWNATRETCVACFVIKLKCKFLSFNASVFF